MRMQVVVAAICYSAIQLACAGAPQSAAMADVPPKGEVGAILDRFLRAPPTEKKLWLSDDFLEKSGDVDYVSSVFSKETYRVVEVMEVQPYKKPPPKKKEMIYVKATLRWTFEGFDGVQTCHFNLVPSKGTWLVDFILC